ncbi:MAG TPA: ELM1/GtrOC1 family putative glycosyltransferase [Gammaproteobacteria bacterium]|nr:ELM1/GtrOC1 family putative glycosyltransferase [Gammaproteobacteria bacterium]
MAITGRPVVIWRFTDGKAGHDIQSRGLLAALSRRIACQVFEIPPPHWSCSLAHLLRRGFPPGAGLPDPLFIIGAGHATHLAMFAARHTRGGSIIVLMQPTLPSRWFDLCLIPDHDDPPLSQANVIATRGPLNDLARAHAADPHRGLILIGGSSRHFHWNDAEILEQMAKVCVTGIRWTLMDSRRTPASLRRALGNFSADNVAYVPSTTTGPDWLRQRLQECGTVWITPDSMAMIHEALTAGAAVGLLRLKPRGPNKINGAIERLARERSVVLYDDWLAGRSLEKACEPFAEADRCARLIMQRFGLTDATPVNPE